MPTEAVRGGQAGARRYKTSGEPTVAGRTFASLVPPQARIALIAS
jgi:hypothetical protein